MKNRGEISKMMPESITLAYGEQTLKHKNGKLRIQIPRIYPTIVQFFEYLSTISSISKQIPKQFDFLWWFSDLVGKLSITRRTIQFNLFSTPLFAAPNHPQLFCGFLLIFNEFPLKFYFSNLVSGGKALSNGFFKYVL